LRARKLDCVLNDEEKTKHSGQCVGKKVEVAIGNVEPFISSKVEKNNTIPLPPFTPMFSTLSYPAAQPTGAANPARCASIARLAACLPSRDRRSAAAQMEVRL